MSDKKIEKPVQLSFEDLKKLRPDLELVVQPLDNGHTKIEVRKGPSKGK